MHLGWVSLQGALALWFAGMARALWQGTLAIGAAWLACRAMPRLSPRLQHWLWRLAYLKLLLCLLWILPIELPLLPAPASPPSLGARSLLAPVAPPDLRPAAVPQAQAGSAPSAAPGPQRAVARRNSVPWTLALLFAGWMLGAVGPVHWLARQNRCARRWLSRCIPLRSAELLALRNNLCKELALRRPPELFLSADVSSPMLVRISRPAVVLPASLLAACQNAHLRLILRHELTHLKRGDLWWAWLPNATRIVCFYHPLLWLAEREWRITAEMACDEEVVLADPPERARYSDLLLLASTQPSLSKPFRRLTVSMTESYPALQRRLLMIRNFHAHSRRRLLLAAAVLAALALPLLLPWRVSAQAPAINAKAASLADRWEDLLLFEAVRYLRLTPSQLQQVRPLARAAADRLHKLEEEEERTRVGLERIVEAQRQALATGRSVSSQQQQDALTMERARRQKREQAAQDLTLSTAPRFARILSAEQIQGAFLLACGRLPANTPVSPALLDPESGFVLPPDAQEQLQGELIRRILARSFPPQPAAPADESNWRRLFPNITGMGSAGSPDCSSCHAGTAPRLLDLGVSHAGVTGFALAICPRLLGDQGMQEWTRAADRLALLGPDLVTQLTAGARPEDLELVVRHLARRLFTSPRLQPVVEESLRLPAK